MKFSQLPLGILQTNCYIAENADQSCLLFDPGSEGPKLINWLNERGLKPLAIFLTHAHFDHIGAVDEVREFFKIPVYAHEKEKNWLSDPTLNGSQQFRLSHSIQAKPAEYLLTREEHMILGDFQFDAYETPGHSPGSISYFFKTAGYVISGDVLFKGSIGRTDLTEGDQEQLLFSIHNKLLSLPGETIVLPGHGPQTTVKEEKSSNPYINGY